MRRCFYLAVVLVLWATPSRPEETVGFTTGVLPRLFLIDDSMRSDLSLDFNSTDRFHIRFHPADVLSLQGDGSASRLGSVVLARRYTLGGFEGGYLHLASEAAQMFFMVNYRGDEPTGRAFFWQRDGSIGNSATWMTLVDGDLRIAGTLTENSSFDISESFWETEPVEPGEVVVLDPARGDAVRLSTGVYDRGMLGVASSAPGVLLGGGAFSVGELEENWGESVALEFELSRADLAERVLEDDPRLRQDRDRLASVAWSPVPTVEATGSGISSHPSALEETVETPGSSTAAPTSLEQARHWFESRLEEAMLRRFFEDRFAAVALAGRVAVKVDASYGPIQPGDYLTSSPSAGVAMRATEPGPILGTALEGLATGSGKILMFVHRGWYGGETARLAVRETDIWRQLEAKDAEITALRRRLADVERAVRVLVTGQRTEPHSTTVEVAARGAQ